MSKNYYDILGVKKNATIDDIKKKYKKLALKWHPDRQDGKSEKEKKEAEEKFREISEAYSVLSDENKRQEYDMFGVVGKHHLSDMGDIFRDMAMHFNSENRAIKKGKTIKVDVNVTFEEIYNNSEITIKYKHLVQCKECNGTGSKDGKVENCSYCGGSGRIRQQHGNPYMGQMYIYETICHNCQGRGKIFKEPCKKCNGIGLEKKEDEIKIKIPNGCYNNAYTVIEGAGDAVPNNDGINGDLIIIFHIVENSIYSTDPNEPFNIIRNVELPVLDCITGCSCEIMGIDGKKYKLNIQPNTLHNSKLRLKKNGLTDAYGNRGDMYICIKMKMPKQPLTEDETRLINELKQNKNWQ